MTPIKVFYDRRQSVEKNKSFSPSAGKPQLVVDSWLNRGLNISIERVLPVDREDFYLVHDRYHTDAVLDLRRSNGFNNTDPLIAKSLYWTNGSLLTAARYALETGETTCSPTSGFHHAEHWRTLGFCTFNGLMIAAAKLKDTLPAGKKIGILDIDMHYGNGTDQIIKQYNITHVKHYTFGGAETGSEGWLGAPRAEEWLTRLPSIVEGFNDCALVIYQAGADPHKDDPFGGALDNDQLRRRDRIVFRSLKKMNIPCVWNFAGGYQEPIQKVIDIHTSTLEECLSVTENN